jgi:hypothetical protein
VKGKIYAQAKITPVYAPKNLIFSLLNTGSKASNQLMVNLSS